MRKEIKEYSTARFILILMVLIGHIVIHCAMDSVYGGVHYDQMLADAGLPDSRIHHYMVTLSMIIYQFHMPAFIALSGALFRVTIDHYKSFGTLVKKKALRLLVPYVVVTMCYSSVIKYFTGTFLPETGFWKSAVFGQLLLGGNNYLWYLWALFIITIGVYLIDKLPCHRSVKVFVLVLIHLSRGLGGDLFFSAMDDMLWFYLGFLFEEHREECNDYILKRPYLTVFALIAVLFVRYELDHIKIGAIQMTVTYLSVFAGTYLVYSAAVLLNHRFNFSDIPFVKKVCRDGMGIYIYSDALNYLVTYLFVRYCGIEILARSRTAAVVLAVKLAVSLFVPMLLCKVLRKLNIKYLY